MGRMRRGPSETLGRHKTTRLPSLCPQTAGEVEDSGRHRAFPLGKSEWLTPSVVLPQAAWTSPDSSSFFQDMGLDGWMIFPSSTRHWVWMTKAFFSQPPWDPTL